MYTKQPKNKRARKDKNQQWHPKESLINPQNLIVT